MSVRNWGYRCELTMPQIELMMSDLPHTLYGKKDTNKSGGGTTLTDDVMQKQLEANRRAKERRERKGVTLNDLFSEKDKN